MTRLFIRFYLGVLLILLIAWFVQNFVSRYRVDEQNARVVEQAMAGSLRVARDWLKLRPDAYDEIVPQIQERYEFPVRLHEIPSPHFPNYARDRLGTYDRIVLYGKEGQGGFVATRVDDAIAVSMGPLPTFVEPAQEAWLTGLGVVLVFVAAAIAVLLRPVAIELRAIEKMATKISDGDLSARIDASGISSRTRLAEAVNSMADQTQSMVRTQRELLQAVSHDLRTPLSKMRFAIDLTASAKTDEDRQKRLEALDATTEELDALVGELLQYVRMETEEGVTPVEEVDLKQVLEDVLDRRSEMYPQLKFEVDVADDVDLRADPRGVQRVLDNLIANACKYAKSTVRISTARQGGRVSLHIEDDGQGIPESDRIRVLNPFVRLQNEEPASEQKSGVGLGLALVARILKRHGGDVQIDESVLGGCRVVTNWPKQAELG